MLHIDRGIDIDPGLEQLLHILIALCMPAALGIIVGQFVHQDQGRLSPQRSVQIKFFQLDAPVVDHLTRQNFQPVQQGQRIRPGVLLHIAHHHIDALFLGLMCRLQHGIRLSHARSISKKNLQSPVGRGALSLAREIWQAAFRLRHGSSSLRSPIWTYVSYFEHHTTVDARKL